LLISNGFFIFKKYDKDQNEAYYIFIWFFIILVGFIFVIGNINDQNTENKYYSKIGISK
jgi:hypothetical protein